MTEHLPLLDVGASRLQNTRGSPSATTPNVDASIRRRRVVLGRATLSFALALFATAVLMTLSWSSPQHASSLELETIMERYRALQFAGVVRLSHNGERKFSDWMGLASEEFDAPMEKHSVFPVGSHSKLFTAVAMHQLQERGRVNLSHSVSAYLEPTDFARFGFVNQTTWCPRVQPTTAAAALGSVTDASSPASPCENVTFVQLLHMGSGLRDQYDSADTAGSYRGSIAKHVGAFINAPLAFRPGTGFEYAHANYVLLSYFVEKLSGQALDAYLLEHVFAPIGLKKTYYDPYSGGRAVHRGFVRQYTNFYVQTPASPEQSQSQLPQRTFVSTGACSAYPDSGALSGAGGVHSTAKDMHRVYKDLFLHRGQQSAVLTQASIRALLRTRNPVQRVYAQGVFVAFDGDDSDDTGATDEDDTWPSKISNCGRMQCVATCMAMQTLGADSVISAAFTNHVEYTFASHDAFAQWQPSDANVSSSAVERGDYQVAELSWALLDVFLRYFQETERS